MTKLLRSTGRLWLLFATFLFAQGAWAQVVISQVYGGGGNSGSIYTNDFIELFNRGTTAVDVTGWTVQYASSAGTTWATTTLSGTIPPGFYYLVQEANGATPSTPLPGPDAIGTINLSGTAGKVALVNTTGALSGTCPTGNSAVQDFVGFGTTANCFKGTGPAPAPSNTTAVLRGTNGCADTQQNATDFTAGTPNPRNSSSPTNACSSTTPTLSANPTSLTGFVATQGTVSNVQTYTLTGRTTSGNPVYVDATANIEMSLIANGQFSSGLAVATTTGTDIISQTIYVRLTKTAPTGPVSGTITNMSNNGALTAIVLVSGQVNAVNAPALSASPTTLSSFSTSQGTVSAEKTYTLTAANLTGTIAVSAPAGVEVSQTSGSGFGSSLTLPMSTTSAVVYVRLTGSGAAGNVSGTITNIAGSLTANVAVSGTVSSTAPVGPYTPIATARAGINSTFTIAGRVTVSTQLGARQIYIQDATGGIAVYSPAPNPDFTSLVNIGDSVQVRGPVTVFSGYLELTGNSNFTVVAGAGSRVPTPIAITPDQLANYQGQLVSVANATLTPVAGSFSGGTNYTITSGNTSGILRISANSPLSGAGQPANPVSVTGIADRFVSGATTTGTNGLQLQPRILADIPGSTPATDLTCTVGSGSPLTRDQTLDIAAWNMEFFGADGGVISCPSGTTLAYNDMGPVNEDLQQTNATQVLTRLNADIISTEEVSDINRFAAAVKAIPGSYSYVCSDKFSYFFQNECDQVPSGNPPTVFGPTSLAQKVCVVYNTATVTPVLAETKPLLFLKTADYTYPGTIGGNGNGSGWASGRLPFLFVANVTINGVTKKIHVVAVHGKSGSAAADFNRRVQDYNDLKAELDQNYPTANVVILGDYNDKATSSIYTNSSVSSFNSFVTDVTNYSVVTKPLEQGGCVTYNPSGGSFIDQMIISNDLQKGYLANTAYVLQPFSIPNYGNTTSDHSPIEARFDISLLASPLTSLSLTASANPTTLLTTGTTTLSATVSGGTTPYSFSFTGPGSITATGNTATVSGLPAGVQTFTVVARDATSPASQTISTTLSVTVTAPVVVTSLSLTASASPTTLLTTGTTTLSATVSGGTTPYSFSFTGPGSISATGNTATVSGLSAGVQTFTVTARDATAPASQTIAATVSVTVSAPAPTGPATLTITSFSCFSTNGALSSVNFVVGYSNGTFTPALAPLFINGVTAAGQLGQQYSFGFDANASVLPIADNASRSVYFVWNFRAACAGPVTPPAPTPPVAPVLANQTATQGTAFSYVVPAFSGTSPISYSATGLPSGLNFDAASRTISGTPSTTGVSTVVISASNTAGQSSGQFTLTVSASATQPTGPATLTITSFSCFSTNGALSSVNFVVGYSNGTFAPALAPLFINGVTASGQLGQQYSFGFDANASVLPIADNASRSTYFVWNFRQACAGPSTPPAPTPPVAPVLANQTATQGTFFSYVVPAFSGTAPITYAATGLPSGLSFDAASRTISGTPSTTGVSTVVISASNTAGQSSGQFTLTVSASATQPTGPATLTITSFSCFSTNGALSSVNFVVGYSNGTFTPALAPLFINGVTAAGQLGQQYSFGFDANASVLPIADNASRSVYFVWNFRAACASRATNGRLSAEPVAPLHLSVLGNPVRHTVEVDVTGAAGGSLNLLLTDAQGRTLGQRQIEQAGSTEKVQFNVSNQPTGILLLRAVTPTQVQTLRVLKAD